MGGFHMDAMYLFILAAVIASFGISFVLRSSMEKLVIEPEALGKIQTKFFMSVAIIEALPILLIVFGFMTLADSTVNAIIPVFLVGITVLINFILNLIKKNELLSHSAKVQSALNALFLMGNVLMAVLPAVAIMAAFIR
jgi:F0F1-type ATP synthase membrane subunit c/vacuolar-type H+-ATPase subunit K